jgi:hypothetical protein
VCESTTLLVKRSLFNKTGDVLLPVKPKLVKHFTEWIAGGHMEKAVVQVELNLCAEFETSSSKCFVDVGVRMWWHDPIFVDAPSGHVHFGAGAFKPELEFKGAREHFKKVVKKADGGHYWLDPALAHLGVVYSYQRYRGYIQQDLHLAEFPFDEQDIVVRFAPATLSIGQFEFVDWTSAETTQSWEEPLEHSLHEWVLEHAPRVETGVEPHGEDSTRTFAQIVVPVQRNPGFYTNNIFLIVFLISVVNWGAFLLEPVQLDQRVIIIISCFLTLVALNFVVAALLPRINISTYLTAYFVLGYSIYALSAVESGVSYLIFQNYPIVVEANATAVDRASLESYPFRVAKILDWSMLGLLVVVQTGLMIIVVSYSNWHWRKRRRHRELHLE